MRMMSTKIYDMSMMEARKLADAWGIDDEKIILLLAMAWNYGYIEALSPNKEVENVN